MEYVRPENTGAINMILFILYHKNIRKSKNVENKGVLSTKKIDKIVAKIYNIMVKMVEVM